MEFRILMPLIIGLTLCAYDESFGSQDEENLVKELFSRYNRLIRPVNHMNETVHVQFTLILSLLINVQERHQEMKTNVWLEFLWKDPQLQWDPADYGGIQSIRLPVDKIWIPDVVLINNANGKYTESYKSNIVVYSTGNLLWLPPSIYKSTCDIKVHDFPFDVSEETWKNKPIRDITFATVLKEQTCDMRFQSWTYNAWEVMLDFKPGTDRQVDMTGYQASGTWDVIKAHGFQNIHTPSNSSNKNDPKIVNITYRLHIRRKKLFFTINLLIPTVLISFLSVLVFYLPTVAGEKVALSISILLTLNVFLLLVSKLLPPASDLPLIGRFLLFTFLMNLVSIVVTVITININFRSPKTHTMPRWIHRIFLDFLPVVLLMRRPKKVKRRPFRSGGPNDSSRTNHRAAPTDERNQHPRTYRSASPGPPDSFIDTIEMSEFRPNDKRRQLHSPGPSGSRSAGFSATLPGYERRDFADVRVASENYLAERDMAEREESGEISLNSPDARLVTNSIQCIVQHHQQNDNIQEMEDDWKYVALVVDRLLLWIFFIATTIGSFQILFSADSIFETIEQAKARPYPFP